MSTTTQSPAPHVADSHDLIRVHGARVNNLNDVSIEIPKRRLTVFTGVSGSGKSSLVFGTIAAESQRLINETYSAFVQGFMPTLPRPEVDVLDGLTTAIIVDQERCPCPPAPSARRLGRRRSTRLETPVRSSRSRRLARRRSLADPLDHAVVGCGAGRKQQRCRREDTGHYTQTTQETSPRNGEQSRSRQPLHVRPVAPVRVPETPSSGSRQ